MKTYEVTIRAIITKTLTVEAGDADKAQQLAHLMFTVDCDGDESYEQDALECKESEEV